MPQPRSISVLVSKATSRAARCAATRARVACSSPSGVKYIRSRVGAELRGRPLAQADLGQGGGDVLGGRRTPQLLLGVELVGPRERGGPLQQVLAVVGQQPPEGFEVHPAILSGPERDPRWHSLGVSASFCIGTLIPRVPVLATKCDPRDGVPPASPNVGGHPSSSSSDKSDN